MKSRDVPGLLAAGLLASLAAAPAAAQDCDRDCLERWVDRYLDALVENDPSAVPLADDVRFTENGQQLYIGDGLWRSMRSKGPYRLFVSDVPAGQVAFIGTIEEDHRDPDRGQPALLALRLRIEDGEIGEIEQLVARNPEAAERVNELGEPHPVFTETIPEGERMSRAALIETSNKYFTGMQQNDGRGDYPFHPECNRIENGTLTTNAPTPEGETRPDPETATNYSAQWTCLEQFESGLLHFVTRIRDRRFVAVDAERGLVFTFVFFDHAAGDTRTFETPDGRTVTAGPAQPWTWYIAEVFRVEDGLLRRIEAVLDQVPYGMSSGWSDFETGMSDEAQDATM